MGVTMDIVSGKTFHRRKGEVQNAFSYRLDYVLVDLSKKFSAGPFFSRNKFNLSSLYDSDHGGERGKGTGIDWARGVFEKQGLELSTDHRILLVAQPRLLGRVFNPVSFWFAIDEKERLLAFIAEVNNTFGERHSYVCHHPDFRPIEKNDRLKSQKIFHVSPFQPVSGEYAFRIHYCADKVGIWIDYTSSKGGVYATFTGSRKPAGTATILSSVIRRPLGALRVLGLIHLQALKLFFKGAEFRSKPDLPQSKVS